MRIRKIFDVIQVDRCGVAYFKMSFNTIELNVKGEMKELFTELRFECHSVNDKII